MNKKKNPIIGAIPPLNYDTIVSYNKVNFLQNILTIDTP